jgi:hypothetical protein
MRRLVYVAFALALAAPTASPAVGPCTGTAAQCAAGEFGVPFDEPTLLGTQTSERCLEDGEGKTRCKPTAGTLVALADDRFLYWNALEGTEDVEVSSSPSSDTSRPTTRAACSRSGRATGRAG